VVVGWIDDDGLLGTWILDLLEPILEGGHRNGVVRVEGVVSMDPLQNARDATHVRGVGYVSIARDFIEHVFREGVRYAGCFGDDERQIGRIGKASARHNISIAGAPGANDRCDIAAPLAIN